MVTGNIIFPLWALLFLHPLFLLVMLMGNLIIDSAVALVFSKLTNIQMERNTFIRLILSIWVAGFLADLAAFAWLFLMAMGFDFVDVYWIYTSIFSIITFFSAIILAAVTIYLIDKKMALKAGFVDHQAKSFAFIMAVVTVPYLMLIPTPIFL